jgi:hypothetical protein
MIVTTKIWDAVPKGTSKSFPIPSLNNESESNPKFDFASKAFPQPIMINPATTSKKSHICQFSSSSCGPKK